jgi:RND superfamily putative drug exporter
MGHGVRVVTAAALIMTSVFGGFVLVEDPVIKSVGFALAIGVAIDAFVVRMTMVPAVMSLLGRSAWWLPGPLGRLMPNVDIEGEHLRRELDDVPQPAPVP